MHSDPSRVRIIWITPKFPLGDPDGARHATCQLLRHLSARDVDIDLVCLAPDGEVTDPAAAQSRLGVRTCTTLHRRPSRSIPWPPWEIPFTFRTFMTAPVRTLVKQCLQKLLPPDASAGGPPPFMVFDGLHTFGALRPADLSDLARTTRGIIYRAHNFETALWDQCVERAHTPWTRAFFRHQAGLVRRFEREMVRSATWTAAVSEDDVRRFQSLVPAASACCTPIGMDFPEDQAILPVCPGSPFELLFIGRLDWLPNREGLRWFLDNVWSALKSRRPTATLKIAGSGDGGWLRRYQHQAGVQMLGRVPDVEPLYQTCALTVAPIFQGSGTRVKILEAARYKRAVLTTALGSEGTGLVPGVSCFHAETAADWLSRLEDLTIPDCRRAGLHAATAIRQHFDGKSIADHFLRRLVSPAPAVKEVQYGS